MNDLEYFSRSYITSIKLQCMLMTIKGKHYFIEYPQNLTPDPRNIFIPRNKVSVIDKNTLDILIECFNTFEEQVKVYRYLRFPDYARGFCISKNLDLKQFNIME